MPLDCVAGDEFQNQPEMPKIGDIKSRFEHPTASDAPAAPVQRYARPLPLTSSWRFTLLR